MAEHDTERVEAWGRHSRIRLDELPKSDPIAYLGTDRHPVSVPPVSRDVETPHRVEEHPQKSHVARRALIAAVCAVIIVPVAFSLTSSSDTKHKASPAVEHAAMTPLSPVQGREATPAEAAVRSDLPPGGLPEVSAPEATADDQRSVADWTSAPPKSGVAATAPDRKTDTAVSTESKARTVPLASTHAHRSAPSRASFPVAASGIDFGAAMNAVSALDIGRTQCGPDASGAVTAAVTFSPTGQATRAVIEDGPLRGTATGSCVARELRSVQIAPFTGDSATIRTTIFLH